MSFRMRRAVLIALGLVVSTSMMLGCIAGDCFFGNDCGDNTGCSPDEVETPNGCEKAPSRRDAGCSGDDCRG